MRFNSMKTWSWLLCVLLSSNEVAEAAAISAVTKQNGVLFQGFEWYVPADQKHWIRLQKAVPSLKSIGVDRMWIPPAAKGSNPEGNGYDIYDLYDVGEFNQKGSIATKWGPKADLQALSKVAQRNGVGLVWDAVLNHRTGADVLQDVEVVEVAEDNRNQNITEPYKISAWLQYTFPGRGSKYSTAHWNWTSFTGTNFNVENNKSAIYKVNGKSWATAVDPSDGNADYLLLNDVDYSNTLVQQDIKNWAKWVVGEYKLSGFRFDAVAHYSQDFQKQLLKSLDAAGHSDLFYVGEYLEDNTATLSDFVDRMARSYSVFDFPLLFNFSTIGNQDNGDLQNILKGTLVSARPGSAVTVVQNHDTQPNQSAQALISDWFKPLAYALILLRKDGYPELFYGDVYGIQGPTPQAPCCGGKLPDLAMARKLYAYGDQVDYFDERTAIGWVRQGTADYPSGLAVLMSSGSATTKKMSVGIKHAGEKWTDILGWEQASVTIDSSGYGAFPCGSKSVSVWTKSDAKGRGSFGKFNAAIYN